MAFDKQKAFDELAALLNKPSQTPSQAILNGYKAMCYLQSIYDEGIKEGFNTKIISENTNINGNKHE